jgi:hypothetical protein
LPVEEQVEKLLAIRTDAVRAPVVDRLAELYLDAPTALANIGPRSRQEVRARLLELARDRHPDRARRVLTILAEEQDELLLELLEEALSHPHSRVRALAHRLLRQSAPAERYLEATRVLLRDRSPEFRRMAVRVLSFRRYAPAAQDIALLLHDREKGLDRVARAGLLVLGAPALPALRRLLHRARPDRRAVFAEVIAAIEGKEDTA